MRHSLHLLRLTHKSSTSATLAILVLLGTACGDSLTTPGVSSIERPAQSGATVPTTPWACFTSVAVTNKPYAYRYDRIPLGFENGAIVAAHGSRMTYRHRVVDNQGTILRLANCVVPRSMAAIQAMNQRFQVPPHLAAPRGRTSGGGDISIQGCVADGFCELDGIVVVAPAPSDNCNFLGCPGYTDGGSTGEESPPSEGGGSSPCPSCSPTSPIMRCSSSMVRGNEVTCNVTFGEAEGDNSLTWSATGWRFESGDGTAVTEPSGSTSWSGAAVVGGDVYVTLRDSNGNSTQLSSSYAVTSRDWRWGSVNWSYTQGAAPVCDSREPVPGTTIHLGWNTNRGTCLPTEGRVLPNMIINPRAGYTLAPQVTSGPNKGYWYVASAAYYMDRVSGLNPQIAGNGTPFQLPEGAQATACRSAMSLGVGAPVNVYNYSFNGQCKGVDVNAFLTAAWGHEGFGANGGTGHESLAHSLAAQRDFDPYALVEDAFYLNDEATLRAIVEGSVWGLNQELSNRAADKPHTVVTGNYPGGAQIWLWDGVKEYILANQKI